MFSCIVIGMRIVHSGRGAAYIIAWESGYIQSKNVARSWSVLIERPGKKLVIAAV